jgi:2,3-bisphosphoglycerate-dependent phosphoglycerate mutase
MTIQIVFETHALTEDNETGRATGWLPGTLSEAGRRQAAELGVRRREDGIAAVFSSDLRRAAHTAEIAFARTDIPILLDWRLRECDYGKRNGMPVADVHGRRRDYLDVPYPGGESWRQAAGRMRAFLADLPSRWSGKRVLVIGHVATRWGLDSAVNGVPLETLADEEFAWQEGWEYRLADSGVAEPPEGLPVYRVLTGPDDAQFCHRVSEAIGLGYRLYEGPAVTFDGTRVVVAQALRWQGNTGQ